MCTRARWLQTNRSVCKMNQESRLCGSDLKNPGSGWFWNIFFTALSYTAHQNPSKPSRSAVRAQIHVHLPNLCYQCISYPEVLAESAYRIGEKFPVHPGTRLRWTSPTCSCPQSAPWKAVSFVEKVSWRYVYMRVSHCACARCELNQPILCWQIVNFE